MNISRELIEKARGVEVKLIAANTRETAAEASTRRLNLKLPPRPTHMGWLCPACGSGNAPQSPTCPCRMQQLPKPNGWPARYDFPGARSFPIPDYH